MCTLSIVRPEHWENDRETWWNAKEELPKHQKRDGKILITELARELETDKQIVMKQNFLRPRHHHRYEKRKKIRLTQISEYFFHLWMPLGKARMCSIFFFLLKVFFFLKLSRLFLINYECGAWSINEVDASLWMSESTVKCTWLSWSICFVSFVLFCFLFRFFLIHWYNSLMVQFCWCSTWSFI